MSIGGGPAISDTNTTKTGGGSKLRGLIQRLHDKKVAIEEGNESDSSYGGGGHVIDEEEFMQRKLEEVRAKAANKLIRNEDKEIFQPKNAMKKGEKKLDQNKAAKESKEEAQKNAINYIMALIKRDTKPTNPETIIMIKLFERFSESKSRMRYFERFRMLLRERLKEIRHESSQRGLILEKEINDAAGPALRMLDSAFREIDLEEKTNAKKPKLTTIQRNRMAMNYLCMND